MNTKLLEKYMSTPKVIEITINDDELFNKTAIMSEKNGYSESDKFAGVPINVSVDEEDLPESVESADKLEMRIRGLVYERIFVK